MRTILPVPGNDDVRQNGDHVILLMCTRRKTNNTVDTERRSLQGDVPRIFHSNYYIRLSRLLKSNCI